MNRIVQIILLILTLVVLSACSASADKPAPLTVTLRASEFHFDLPTITARIGQPVTIQFENQGALEHQLEIEALGVTMENVLPGKISGVTFTPLEAGTYIYVCKVPGHAVAGMTGTLIVTP